MRVFGKALWYTWGIAIAIWMLRFPLILVLEEGQSAEAALRFIDTGAYILIGIASVGVVVYLILKIAQIVSWRRADARCARLFTDEENGVLYATGRGSFSPLRYILFVLGFFGLLLLCMLLSVRLLEPLYALPFFMTQGGAVLGLLLYAVLGVLLAILLVLACYLPVRLVSCVNRRRHRLPRGGFRIKRIGGKRDDT